jgi:hypothetical protein
VRSARAYQVQDLAWAARDGLSGQARLDWARLSELLTKEGAL